MASAAVSPSVFDFSPQPDNPPPKPMKTTHLLLTAALLTSCASTPTASAPPVSAATSPSVTASSVIPYPLKTCIVTDNDLGSMGDEQRIVHQGREIKFCCSPCIGKFKANPAKYLAKLN
jgi:hypothetical protein